MVFMLMVAAGIAETEWYILFNTFSTQLATSVKCLIQKLTSTNHRVTLLSASSYHVLLKRKCAADIPLPGAPVPRDKFKRKLVKLSRLQHRCPRCSYADDHI
jgi:hypothetical protein